MKIKNKRRILKLVLYMCGIFCIVYPLYSKFLTYKNQSETIYDFETEINNMDKEALEEKRKKTDDFNNESSVEAAVIDPNQISDENTSTNSYNFLEVGEMIGYISIPKINVELPVYEGVTVNTLSIGVAHMENTSLPNGADNTHAVLAGHTGISNAEIFDNLNELEIGDTFYVTFLGDKIEYKIIDERIVLPDETSSLKVEEGRCLVTLVTCTPKTVNTHRLLVTGEKVEEVAQETEEDISEETTVVEEPTQKSDFELLIGFIKTNKNTFIIILFLIILLIIINIISYIKRKIKEKKGIKDEKNST